jgi:GTPase Era involved in 16S rRNA processing
MSIFELFIEQFPALEAKQSERSTGLLRTLGEVEEALTQPSMYASEQLKSALKRLKIRAEEPMKVAITGQFSSGKSTFLNALLGKNILPTGITPVTSKVNYIRYGDEFRVIAHFLDGREAIYAPENLSQLTDQRHDEASEIDYLTLYAPLALLRDIIFVDTPGLNSQSFSDTAATEAVLKEVDGIIWLSLIDNAGKQSEAEALERYMQGFADKSLCVLNQKDKFTPEQVAQTTSYVQSAFADYFASVIPISAKQAAEARDTDTKAREESNIESVMEFIYREIQPKASESKEYAISRDARALIAEILAQEEQLIGIYDELLGAVRSLTQEARERFGTLGASFSARIGDAYLKIEEIIERICHEILAHKSTETRVRYAPQKQLLGRKEFYVAHPYEAPKINSDEVYKKLFFDDDFIGKMFKQYLRHLDEIRDELNRQNLALYEALEARVLSWREPNEIRRKQRAVHSDIQFANLRRFASKSYENILRPYATALSLSYADVSSEFRHVSSCVKFNYQNATEVVIGFISQRVEKSAKLYEENPTQFTLYEPKFADIKERLRTAFHIYELENMMKNRNFITRNYEKLGAEFERIEHERLSLIEEGKNEYVKLKSSLIQLSEKVK